MPDRIQISQVFGLGTNPVKKRLAHGALWSTFGIAGSRSLQVVMLAILARMLGKAGFGELAILQSTVGMFSVFAGFGLGLTSTKYIAELRWSDPRRAARISAVSLLVGLCTGAVTALIMFLFSDVLATRVLAAPHLGSMLRISALTLFLSALNGVQQGSLTGFEAFRRIAAINWIGGFGSLVLLVGGAYWNGLMGATWGLVFSTALTCILCQRALRRVAASSGIPLTFKGCLTEKRVLWRFSVPAVLAGVSGGGVGWIANALLVNTSTGYAQLGLFNAANAIRTVFMFVPSIVIQASFPLLAATYARRAESRDFETALVTAHNYVNVPCLLAAILLMFVPDFAMVPFGPSYKEASGALLILMSSVAVQSLGCVAGATIQARGDMWLGLRQNLLWGAVLLAVVAKMAAHFGALALALANLLGYVVLVLAQLHNLRRDLPRSLMRAVLRTLLLVAAIVPLAMVTARAGALLIQAPAGVAAALLAAWCGSARIKEPNAPERKATAQLNAEQATAR